jgi:protein involved in polysaccharide export with SLBB domain
LLLSLLLLVGSASLSLAQEAPKPQAPTKARKEYRLRPGDRISIILADHPDESQKELLVSTDGTISFYTVRNFRIVGLTRGEAEQGLEQQLDLKDPRISINLINAPGMMITVAGAVGKPGPLEYSEGMTLLDAIARSGWLRGDADKTATIRTTDEAGLVKAVAVDLIAAERGELAANPELAPGDLIQIGSAMVTVNGEVKKSGSFPLRGADTVFRAIAAAEGISALGDSHRVLLRRDGQTYVADLDQLGDSKVDLASAAITDAVLSPEKLLPGDFPLKHGDTIVVPTASITIYGAVVSPSQYTLAGMDTGLQALTNAKGPTVAADLEHARVLRDGGRQQIVMDLTNTSPDAPIAWDGVHPVGAYFPLRPGDVLMVPEKEARVRVFGAVGRSGDYRFVSGTKDRLLDALGEASVTPISDLAKVKLQRVIGGKPQTMVLNVGVKGAPADNVILVDGDRIDVPSIKASALSPILYSVGSTLLGVFLLKR